MSDNDATLKIPAQQIPAPRSISPQGRAYLAAAASRIEAQKLSDSAPPDQAMMADAALHFLRPMAARFEGTEDAISLPSGAKVYRVTPAGRTGRKKEVAYVDIHGGAFIAGGGEMCQILAKIRAIDYGVEVYAIDYRLLPDHPYPSSLDDCMAGYREILKRQDASNLVLAGASAGGNLAAALMLRATDEKLALPAALILQTPALDMTRSGDSYQTNRFLDVNLQEAGEGPAYGAGCDLKHPYISPLFGNFTQSWPPTLLSTGTRDLLLSDTVRMHRALRRAGVSAELHVSEAGPHGGFMGAGAPEDAEIIAECRRFARSAWQISDAPQ